MSRARVRQRRAAQLAPGARSRCSTRATSRSRRRGAPRGRLVVEALDALAAHFELPPGARASREELV